MKKVTSIFIGLGAGLTIGYSLYLAIFGSLYFYFIFAGLSLIFASVAAKNLKNDKKKIAIGILLIIFCSGVGGILYLAWNPEKDSEKEETYTINSELLTKNAEVDETYRESQIRKSSSWICPNCGKKNFVREICDCGCEKPYGDEANNTNATSEASVANASAEAKELKEVEVTESNETNE